MFLFSEENWKTIFNFTTLSIEATLSTGGDRVSLEQLFKSKVIFLGKRQSRRTTLEDVLKKRSLGLKEALIVTLRVAKALTELHQVGLVHGDLTVKSVLVRIKKNVCYNNYFCPSRHTVLKQRRLDVKMLDQR